MKQLPLRYAFPLVLLLFGIVQVLIILGLSSNRIEKNYQDDAIRNARTEMSRLQGTLQFLSRLHHQEQMQSELAALGSDITLIEAFLFDQNNTTIASNKVAYKNLPFTAVKDRLSQPNQIDFTNKLKQIRTRMRGKVWIDSNGQSLSAMYPVLLMGESTQLRPNNVGVLYIKRDLSLTNSRIENVLVNQAMVVLLALFLISLALGYFLYRFVSRRIEILVKTTDKFASGVLSSRANLEGNDEIAKLSTAFDDMANQVTATQENLRGANQRLQLIMDSAAEAIIGVDVHATCIFVNKRCLQLLGYNDVNDLLGKDMRKIVVNRQSALNSAQEYDGRMFLTLQKATPWHVENEVLWRRDGSCFNSEYWSHPMIENGNCVGAVITLLDVSKRVMALEELESYQNNLESLVSRRTKELEISNQELSSYSYSIAHDLRTPLRAVTSFSQILEEDAGDKLNESEIDALQRITSAGKHMAKLIDDILELSKLSRVNLNLEEIDLEKLALEVFETAREAYSNIEATISVQKNLSINADKTLLSLVLENLISNAIKYHDGKPISIEIGGTHHSDHSEFFVADNGIGFDMRFSEKIFKPFERLHHDRAYAGTGVGLSIVKRIIERHGGRIWASSRPNHGTTFYFSIPRQVVKHLVI